MEVTVQEAHSMLGSAEHCLIDVRTLEEVASTRIAGALHIPLDRLPNELGHLTAYRSIHIICHAGGRSVMATSALRAMGMLHVQSVAGGIMAWESQGLPVVR